MQRDEVNRREVHEEYYPENMSNISVWKGLCTPRTDAFCRRTCGDRPCGYYREVLKRGIDLDELSRRPPKRISVEVSEEEIAEVKKFQRDRGMRIDEVCKVLGVSRHTYINFTKGRPVTPRIKGIIRKGLRQWAV